MSRKLIALLMCMLLLVPAALADDSAGPTYYYPAEELNFLLFLAPEWETLATEEGIVYPLVNHVTDDTGAVIAGSCIFSYEIDEDTFIALGGAVMYPADGAPEDAQLTGCSYSEVYRNEEFAVSAAWADLSAVALPEDAPVERLEAVIASFRDTDKYIFITEKADSLGDFHTTGLDGAEYTSQSVFSGEYKLTLVNVWATYCQPCLSEMPYLGELAEEYADRGVQIIGIPSDIFDSAGNVDADQIELAKRYAQSTGATYPHLIPDDAMLSGLLREVYYVPNSWFFDSEGKLLGEAIVGSYSKDDWVAMIEEHLAMVEK